ncbi:MAG: asparagine synthase C-terminal domain-containing protein, partial [Deltaproteobacteria bacterium]|nr:asparagine synthase C-terminal domain-containing protein [Deltaproteobacteria bacterium]
FGRADDEFPYARLVAERYGTEHTEIRLDENLEQRVERTFRCYGEPFADSSAVPTVAVYEAVSRYAKVVLTGDGGDELFAGYGRYQQAARWPKLSLASWLAKGIDNPRWMRFKAISRLRRGLALASARSDACGPCLRRSVFFWRAEVAYRKGCRSHSFPRASFCLNRTSRCDHVGGLPPLPSR